MSSPHAGWSSAESGAGRRVSAASALRHSLLWASRRRGIQRVVSTSPLTRPLVRRFVAGESVDDAVAAVSGLAARGLAASVDRLGEDSGERRVARETAAAYRALIERLARLHPALAPEVSLKLSALGLRLDEEEALSHARQVCAAAAEAGVGVTLDMEDHTITDPTLRVAERLRAEFPSVGVAIQASLRRSVADCGSLAHPGSRVRLCKGAYQEPASLAWQRRDDIRAAFLRCLSILVAGGAYPMVATHDPRLIAAAARMVASPRLTAARGGAPVPHEHQMLFGVRADEQLRLARSGSAVRVYVPFGRQWYPYLMRRIAERPANLALVLRALAGR